MADYKPKGMSNSKIGGVIRGLIMKGLPSLGELTDKVQRNSKRGYLIGLDGRKLYVRSEHSALNVLLQGAGAIVMKVSMIYLDRWTREQEIDCYKVLDMHDEAQAEVLDNETMIKTYCNLAEESVRQAGRFLKLRVPLDAEAKVGYSWAETH